MNKFRAVVFPAAKVSDWIAGMVLTALAGFIIANIIARLFKVAIPSNQDYVGLLGGILVALSIAYCQVQEGHVFISFVVDRFRPRTQAVVNTITSIVGVVLFMVLAWRCGVWGTETWTIHQEVGLTGLPLYPFVYVVGFGSFLLALVLIVDVYRYLVKVVRQ